MAKASAGFLKTLSLGGIALGVVIFGVGVAILSAVALVAIGLAAFGAISYTWLSLGRKLVFAGLGSALVGGLIAWVAMRSMMRWVALNSGLSPVLTLEGTSAILGTSLIMSILPAMGYVHFRLRFKPTLGRSLLYGLLLSAIGGIPLVLIVSGEISAIAREPAIPISFLLGVPILFAVALEAAHRIFSHSSPTGPRHEHQTSNTL